MGEEEDQFYDAGENAAQNSSDVTTDLNFSVANEDLPSDRSDYSEQDTVSRSKPQTEPILDNFNDISADKPSSLAEGTSPKTGEALLNNDNVSEGSKSTFCSESEHNEDAVSPPLSNDAAHQGSSEDLRPDEPEKSTENEPLNEDTAVNANNSSKSSIEVMEDDTDSSESKSSPEKVIPNSDALNETNDDHVKEDVVNSTKDSEMISENKTPLDSASAEKSEKIPEASEILSMDDSDVDESLQENLDVALKMVEESQSPVHTSSEEPGTSAKTDDSANNDDSLDTASKSENILEEFQEDAAKINGDSSELLDSRLCPCQVVLFRIDFDEYALKYLKNKTEPSSDLDTSLTKVSDDDSEKTPTRSSPPRRRVLTKAARKMIPSPVSVKKTPSPRARNSRVAANTESTRPRRKAREASAKVSKYVHSNSSDSEDAAPKTSHKKQKAVVNGSKRSARIVTQPPQRTSSRRSVPEKVENFDKELSIDLSGDRTLKCVSLPVITDLLVSLEDRTCSELLALIERRGNKSSQITKSKLKKSTTAERSSRRRKLSPSDTSKSSIEDDDYKSSSKMWKHDEGTSRKENLSSRSSTKSTTNKRSSGRNAKVQNYGEDSGSDDEAPSKKTKTRSRGNSTRTERSEKKDTSSDKDEAENSPSE